MWSGCASRPGAARTRSTVSGTMRPWSSATSWRARVHANRAARPPTYRGPADMAGGRRWDVVIVGARVAVASTALLLARAGLKVLVVDRARRGSDTLSTH